MSYRFGIYELDPIRFELRERGVTIAVEPQVLTLLLFLVANRDRLVSKDELVDMVWQGRIVSDAAISSRIKSARRLVGDNGSEQRVIRTVHGRGFQFIADLIETGAVPRNRSGDISAPVLDADRPSIAVLPFAVSSDLGSHDIVAHALPQEIIRELARMRWLFVIARASSFRFGGPTPDACRVGEALNVGYVLHGTVNIALDRLCIDVELVDTRDARIIWAEHFEVPTNRIPSLQADIVRSIVATLELRIPLHEAEHARLSCPETVQAWSAYHLGLQRMFRFTAIDNAAASDFFEQAIACEPDFARAHAGLSFVRFQDAFLDYDDAAMATLAAREAAERAVALDPLDPFANVAMGRAHWLSGNLDTGLGWLDRATTLSPNYAQGVYARAWSHSLLGHGAEGQLYADQAMALSPLDPLRYAMLATRALSHLVRDEDEEAAHWAERGACEPGAHAFIAVIAAACHAANGNDRRARAWIANAQQRQPTLSCARFFQSFPFADADLRQRITDVLRQSGLGVA